MASFNIKLGEVILTITPLAEKTYRVTLADIELGNVLCEYDDSDKIVWSTNTLLNPILVKKIGALIEEYLKTG